MSVEVCLSLLLLERQRKIVYKNSKASSSQTKQQWNENLCKLMKKKKWVLNSEAVSMCLYISDWSPKRALIDKVWKTQNEKI